MVRPSKPINGFFDKDHRILVVMWEKNFEADLASYNVTGGKIIHSKYNFYPVGSKISNRVGAVLWE